MRPSITLVDLSVQEVMPMQHHESSPQPAPLRNAAGLVATV
jgi:hypothetical protein